MRQIPAPEKFKKRLKKGPFFGFFGFWQKRRIWKKPENRRKWPKSVVSLKGIALLPVKRSKKIQRFWVLANAPKFLGSLTVANAPKFLERLTISYESKISPIEWPYENTIFGHFWPFWPFLPFLPFLAFLAFFGGLKKSAKMGQNRVFWPFFRIWAFLSFSAFSSFLLTWKTLILHIYYDFKGKRFRDFEKIIKFCMRNKILSLVCLDFLSKQFFRTN